GRGVGGRADVEAHRDVGAELALDLRDALRSEPGDRAVVDGAKGHPTLVEPEDRVAKREDLEPARVGEDRPFPSGKRVEAAELFDHVFARAEVKVVRVPE